MPISTAHWLSAVTVEGDDWASLLQEVPNTVWTIWSLAEGPEQRTLDVASYIGLHETTQSNRTPDRAICHMAKRCKKLHTSGRTKLELRARRLVQVEVVVEPVLYDGRVLPGPADVGADLVHARPQRRLRDAQLIDAALREHCTPVQSPARRGDGAIVARASATLKDREPHGQIPEVQNSDIPISRKVFMASCTSLDFKELCFRIAFVVGLQFVRAHPGRISANRKPLTRGLIRFIKSQMKHPTPTTQSGFSHVVIVPDIAVGRRVFSGISRFPIPFILALLHTHLNKPHRLSRPQYMRLIQYQLDSPLVDDRPIMNIVKYRVVSGVVWTNLTMVSSNTDTYRTGVLTVVDIGPINTPKIFYRFKIASMFFFLFLGRLGSVVDNPLTSHQGEPGSIPARVTEFFASGNRAGRCRWSAGFLGDLRFPPAPSFRRHSICTSITLIGSQDLAVKSSPNLFTQPRYFVSVYLSTLIQEHSHMRLGQRFPTETPDLALCCPVDMRTRAVSQQGRHGASPCCQLRQCPDLEFVASAGAVQVAAEVVEHVVHDVPDGVLGLVLEEQGHVHGGVEVELTGEGEVPGIVKQLDSHCYW
ncbi:hypothetical protein PR048_029591 [Dryococelus australis]|uniref:Uncharacterized protein n=1 Tax=Dryococelus australis TaxID=614101 RepID=A0ABQ9GFZ7_9NEOP|nr:hypothetical protein PR048_029591 [Dryococelus australis]